MRNERQAAAEYVTALSTELARIAYRHGLDAAAYMLEMAAAEAAGTKPKPKPNPANGIPRPLDALAG